MDPHCIYLTLIVGDAQTHTHINTPMPFIFKDDNMKVIFVCGEQTDGLCQKISLSVLDYPIIFTNICLADTAYYLNVSLPVPLSRSCPKDEFSLSLRGKDNFKPSVLSCCFLCDVRYRAALQTDSQRQIRK